MKISRSKTTASAIALFLMFAIAVSLVALPAANAHTPPWTIISYAYLVASPNPVGVGQPAAIVMWVDCALPGASAGNDIRRHDYTLTITKPDGTTETEHWDVLSDSTGIQYYQYVPAEVGNYTLKFDYAEQTYTWSGAYQNDVFTAASRTQILTVQEEPIPSAIDSYPLPTEYWTRPIEGQNTYWYTVSSNWLGPPYTTILSYGMGAYQPEGPAPNSAHVMWSKPIQDGGVAGGNIGIPGEMYYEGGSYNVRFSNPLIMYGRLYYELPYGNSGGGGGWICVDLRTGEEIWYSEMGVSGSGLSDPSFGYIYAYDMRNQHGIIPNGWLFSRNFGTAYDPATGRPATLSITDVPRGSSVGGPSGEYLIYVLDNLGNTTNPDWYLMQWNSSNVFNVQTSGTRDASTPNRYDWNVSLTLPPGSWSIGQGQFRSSSLIDLDNIMLLIQGTFGGHVGEFGVRITDDPANITAINLKPESRGQVLWTESYPPAPGNNSRFLTDWDPKAGVFVFQDKESMVHYGYSLADGSYLWGPTVLTNDYTTDYNYFALATEQVAYGKLYYTGYSGILYCYDVKNGTLLWTYGNGGEGNSTLSGFTTPWGRYPTFISIIADGKVYLETTEHSPTSPLYKDAKFRAINATDGTEIWTLMHYAGNMYGGVAPVGDGYLVFFNGYDQQIYCIGKGPSATAVTASPKVSVHGSSVLVEGSVIDIAAGTKQHEQAARFPNGVPAVSEESMGAWMEYVYMQKPRPTDTTGVEVVLTVLDPNNNYYEVGRTTSDASGMFSCAFTPEVPGKYTIIASFEGSEGYWPSFAETALNVEEAPAATPAPTPTPAPMTDTYVLGIGSAILIAVVIGFALLLLRKR